MLASLLLLAAQPAAAEVPPPCDKPVLMVVTGRTLDRERMLAYGRAIADSRLYEELGGYYLNIPAPVDSFEGGAPTGHTTLIVRFPCLANAQAFWHSRAYQEDIRPLRLEPSAGDYVVRVYPEAPVPGYMAGKVGEGAYSTDFNPSPSGERGSSRSEQGEGE